MSEFLGPTTGAARGALLDVARDLVLSPVWAFLAIGLGLVVGPGWAIAAVLGWLAVCGAVGIAGRVRERRRLRTLPPPPAPQDPPAP